MKRCKWGFDILEEFRAGTVGRLESGYFKMIRSTVKLCNSANFVNLKSVRYCGVSAVFPLFNKIQNK